MRPWEEAVRDGLLSVLNMPSAEERLSPSWHIVTKDDGTDWLWTSLQLPEGFVAVESGLTWEDAMDRLAAHRRAMASVQEVLDS